MTDERTPLAIRIGAAIRAALTKADLTQASLGDRMGVSQGNVSDWVRGTRTPSLATILELEYALDLAPGALLIDAGIVGSETPTRGQYIRPRYITVELPRQPGQDIALAEFGVIDTAAEAVLAVAQWRNRADEITDALNGTAIEQLAVAKTALTDLHLMIRDQLDQSPSQDWADYHLTDRTKALVAEVQNDHDEPF